MSFWSAAIGAFAGGVVGGPVGAGVGAAIGAWLSGQSDSDEQPPELPMDLRFEDDEDGRQLLLIPNFAYTEGLVFRIDLVREPGADPLPATGPLHDDAGAFFTACASWPQDDGSHFSEAYVPFGAFALERGHTPLLRVISLDDQAILGVSHFELDWPRVSRMSPAVYLRPLVGLSMAVARADGELSREEVRCVREVLTRDFDLEGDELETLRHLMKTRDGRSVPDHIRMLGIRLPEMDPQGLLGFLVDVAHADGRIHPGEVAVIHEVAAAWGFTATDWEAFAAEAGLVSGEDALEKARKLLGVTPHASVSDIKSAFRAKIRAYHPDIVAGLAIEFQDLAKQKSQELNEAYHLLLDAAR